MGEGTLARSSLLGSAPRVIAEHVREADWSPEGGDLAIVRRADGFERLEFPLGTVLYLSSGYISDIRFGGDDSPARCSRSSPERIRDLARREILRPQLRAPPVRALRRRGVEVNGHRSPLNNTMSLVVVARTMARRAPSADQAKSRMSPLEKWVSG